MEWSTVVWFISTMLIYTGTILLSALVYYA